MQYTVNYKFNQFSKVEYKCKGFEMYLYNYIILTKILALSFLVLITEILALSTWIAVFSARVSLRNISLTNLKS